MKKLFAVLSLCCALTMLLAPTPPVHGQSFELLKNGDFETGGLSPWIKWPATAPGTAQIIAGGAAGSRWAAKLAPNGASTALYQTITVVAGTPIGFTVGYLQFSNPGIKARLAAWSNAGGGTWTPCAQIVSSYPNQTASLTCDYIFVPYGTTNFNVQLFIDPVPTGQWVISDNFSAVPILP